MKKIRKAIIPAAGLGTRLLPATKAQPKEMLTIVDKPALQYIIEEVIEAGIDEILVITGRNKMTIENHFDYSYELEKMLEENNKIDMLKEVQKISRLARIHYVRQKLPLGLGHSINCAKHFVNDEPFVVLLGDDIIYTDEKKPNVTLQMIKEYNKLAENVNILGVQQVERSQLNKYGVIDIDKNISDSKLKKVLSIVEKPSIDEAPTNYAVLGRYILQPEIFKILDETKPDKNNEIQLTDAILEMINKGIPTYGYVFDGIRYDTGNKIGMLKANIEFAMHHPELKDDFKAYLIEYVNKL